MRLRARRSTAVLKHSWRLFAIAIVMGGDWLGGAPAQQAAPADQAAVYEIRDGSGIGVFAPEYGARRGFFAGVSQKF
jgi:hypothetical protein